MAQVVLAYTWPAYCGLQQYQRRTPIKKYSSAEMSAFRYGLDEWQNYLQSFVILGYTHYCPLVLEARYQSSSCLMKLSLTNYLEFQEFDHCLAVFSSTYRMKYSEQLFYDQ